MSKLFVKIFKKDSSYIFEMKFLFIVVINFYIIFVFYNCFFSVKLVIKSLFKSKRFQIVIRQIIKNKISFIQTTIAFDVNRDTLLNRVKNKKFVVVDYDKKCRLLNETEKSVFFPLINKYCKFNFSFKYKMIKNKIMKFRVFRIENLNSIKFH